MHGLGHAPVGGYSTPQPISPIQPIRPDPWEHHEPEHHTEEPGMEDEDEEEPM